jgi:hypothetical protein
MMVDIRVVNIRDYVRDGRVSLPENAVYIGRAAPRYGLKASPLANPYRIGQWMSRMPMRQMNLDDVIYWYRIWFLSATFGLLIFEKARLFALAEKGPLLLVCWCAPKPCHGDVIVEYLREPAR